ncbi:MAG: hypothetical protein KKH68_08740 [Proteobacteria bacterium]|nr:hypothetical protein [Pseudomonadota bacterium]
MNNLEIEVKFSLTDIQAVRNRIIELGAEYIRRAFETNIRFEDNSENKV